MENTNEEFIDVLNDLIQINNDRIEGYEKAIEDTKSGTSDYQSVFNQMTQQSSKYKQELITEVRRIGGADKAEWNGTTNSGKVYRMWMDIKSAFTGKTDKSALELCEYGEGAAQKVYDAALDSDNEMPEDTRSLITKQKMELKQSHDLIKRERDMERVVS